MGYLDKTKFSRSGAGESTGIEDLPSLIDLVFLLLTFSLVSMSVQQTLTKGSENKEGHPIKLPEVAKAVKVDSLLHTLYFQVQDTVMDIQIPGYATAQKETAHVIYVLIPGTSSDSTFITEAVESAKKDTGQYAIFTKSILGLEDNAFDRTRPCLKINQSIRQFVTDRRLGPSLSNYIGLRVDKDTPFRIVSYILDACSQYEDTIPRCVIRTSRKSG